MSTTAEHRRDEAVLVWSWRFEQALNAGLDIADAERFASGPFGLEQLRRLVAGGCPPRLIARIVT